MKANVVIIGAGLTGLVAGQQLLKEGIEGVLLVDKGRSVGGRLATRRIGEGKVDHGCQFFSAFADPFFSEVKEWTNKGWVNKWFGGTHPRYRSVGGMNQLAKHIAEGLNVQCNTKVLSISKVDSGYVLETETEKIECNSLIVTAPMPQTIEMFSNGGIELPEVVNEVSFNPSIVAVYELSESVSIDELGYLDHDLAEGIARLVDHEVKGISSTPIVSAQMGSQWSKDNFDRNDDELLNEILEKLAPYFASEKVISMQLKRWRYSEVANVLNVPFIDVKLTEPCLLAGDAFLFADDPAKKARFESGALSGIAVAMELVRQLKGN